MNEPTEKEGKGKTSETYSTHIVNIPIRNVCPKYAYRVPIAIFIGPASLSKQHSYKHEKSD